MIRNDPNLNLCAAAACGDVPAAQDAMQRGADVQCYAHAPLVQAVKHRQDEMVRLLIANGAMNRKAVRNATKRSYKKLDIDTVYEALRAAVQNDDPVLTRLLLQQGIDLPADSYMVALDAIRYQRLKALPVLVEYGLDTKCAARVAIDEVLIRTSSRWRPTPEPDDAEMELRVALVQQFLEMSRIFPNGSSEVWTDANTHPEIKALCVGMRKNTISFEHKACRKYHESLKAEVEKLNVLPCADRLPLLISIDGTATALLKQLAAAHMLEGLFDVKQWGEDVAQGGALLTEMRRALPPRYRSRLHAIDTAPFAAPVFSHAVKISERKSLGDAIVRR